MVGSTALHPRDGWDYVGCQTCGNVVTVPSDRLAEEDTPWCVHSGNTYTWRLIQTPGDMPRWTRMVRVDVNAR